MLRGALRLVARYPDSNRCAIAESRRPAPCLGAICIYYLTGTTTWAGSQCLASTRSDSAESITRGIGESWLTVSIVHKPEPSSGKTTEARRRQGAQFDLYKQTCTEMQVHHVTLQPHIILGFKALWTLLQHYAPNPRSQQTNLAF